jgi:hypothetical protein
MSFTFANLPGVQVQTVDGGLAAVNTPTNQSIMVLGTSATGPANSPYQVVSVATATTLFGLDGTLIRGMSEAAVYCDNVYLMRIGTAQGTLLVGTSGSGFGPNNPIESAVLVGGQITYTLVGTPTPDLLQGSPFTVTGFTAAYYNVTAQPIASVGANTIVVNLTGHVDEAIESPTVTDTYSSFPTAQATSTTSLTLNFTGSPTAGVVVGSEVVLSALDDSAHDVGSWNTNYIVSQVTAHTLVLTGTGLVVGGPSTLIAGALSATKAIGKQPVAAQPGYLITLGQVEADANSRYSVWYAAGALSIWLDNELVYSNDPVVTGSSAVINTGDCVISGSATGGTAIGTGTDSLATAVQIQNISGGATYVAPQTGIGLTGRQLYIAQQNAMNLLQGFPIDEVIVPGALGDNPNVAFYLTGPSPNNPATNPNALDWLWTGVDAQGNPIYQWASETLFWNSTNQSAASALLRGQGSTTTAVSFSFSDPTTRLASGVGAGGTVQPSGFHEVNFAYQLARFCFNQSEAPQADNGGALGFIGFSGPASLSNFSLPAVKAWIGYLPVYDPITGLATVSGAGLLGIPYLVGCAASSLNTATTEGGSRARVPGLFDSDSGEYDGGPEIDSNGYKVDMGAYLCPQGDYALLSNGYGTYVGNISGIIAGLVSTLDQQKAVTNKPVAGAQQLYRASLNQLDALTFADVNMLRYKGVGALPVALIDKTAATSASDYTLALRQRIKFLVIQTLLTEANNYIGNGTNDGLSLVALKTSLDADCLNLQKRGYLSSYNFTITSTPAQQKIGQASIQISFVPANELVQLNATIGINLNA